MDDEMDYAEAIIRLEDEVDRACSHALDHGLSRDDVAKELRRLADEYLNG